MLKHPIMMFVVYALVTLWGTIGGVAGATLFSSLAWNISGFLVVPVFLTALIATGAVFVYMWVEKWIPHIDHLGRQWDARSERTQTSARGY